MRIGLIDFDGKIPNLALMKLSAFYKKKGATVVLNHFEPRDVDKVFCSVIFEKNRHKAAGLASLFPDIEFGGTGWDIKKTLPARIECCRPDYDLYRMKDLYPRLKGIMTKQTRQEKVQTLLDAGIGFTTRGCIRTCEFCKVPEKEGRLRQVGSVGELINPRSKTVIILDNNFTADPDCIEKLREIRERDLTINITQGIDIRLMTPEIAAALASVKHLRSIHYAWDLMPFEHKVMEGIGLFSRFVKTWKHLCYMLVGFDTSFEEDMYRLRTLAALGVTPYVMIFNGCKDLRLQHFARWVNGFFYKKEPDFDKYEPWVRDRDGYAPALF